MALSMVLESLSEFLLTIPGAFERYSDFELDEFLKSKLVATDGSSTKFQDGLKVSTLTALFGGAAPEKAACQKVLQRELLDRGLYLNDPRTPQLFERPRHRLQSDFTGTNPRTLNGPVFHGEWHITGFSLDAIDQMPFRLVSPKFLMKHSLTDAIIPLRLMLTVTDEGVRVHLSVADAVSATFRIYVNDSFMSDEISHHFGEDAWASVTVDDSIQPVPLKIGAIITGTGEAKRMRKGTDIDALPSMSNLLDVDNPAIKEILKITACSPAAYTSPAGGSASLFAGDW